MRSILFLFIAIAPSLRAQLSCSEALQVTLGTHAVPSPMFGTPMDQSCISNVATSHASWYRFTATADTAIMVSSNVAGNPVVYTRVHILQGPCDELTCVAGDDYTGPNYTSQTWFRVRANQSYYIVWDDLNTQWAFSFSMAEYDPPDGAVNFSANFTSEFLPILGMVDMDRNGLDDLVLPADASVTIGYQQNDGSIQTSSIPTGPTTNNPSWSFSVGDWDANGHRDMIYGGGTGASFMQASSDGTSYSELSFPQFIFCQRTNFADINNDGHLDAFSCHDVDANVAFINDGAGGLTFDQGGYGTTCGNYGSLFTDIDNDGDLDLFIAKCGCDAADLLLLNDGEGNFTDLAPQLGLDDDHQSWSAAWGDFDNDGDMDALIGSSDGGPHKLLRNEGGGLFTDISAGSGLDTYPGSSNEWTTHDFNNDGWLDILGGYAMHYNRGDMTFDHDIYSPVNGPVGDMNNDGYLDIGFYDGYKLNLGSGSNWIRVVPVGVQSNRDGIGARVTVESALGQQIREVRSGDGFRYMSFLGAHFGLGPDDTVERIHIRWPSGVEDEILNPAINITHTITEGVSTGLGEHPGATVSLQPNPALDVVYVKGVAPNSSVMVFDASGRMVLNATLTNGQLNVSSLKAGIYQFRVVGVAYEQSLRFTKE